jgi:hypothetical protein
MVGFVSLACLFFIFFLCGFLMVEFIIDAYYFVHIDLSFLVVYTKFFLINSSDYNFYSNNFKIFGFRGRPAYASCLLCLFDFYCFINYAIVGIYGGGCGFYLVGHVLWVGSLQRIVG